MKRFFRPLIDHVHKYYESKKFYKAPRSRSKKQRRYEHVDLTKEFEMRHKLREQEKHAKLEELYEKHDRRALEMKDVITTTKPAGEATTSEIQAVQEAAYAGMMEEMKEERDKLIEHFNKDADLKEKILLTGVKKICVLGMIKYHQIRQNLFEEVSLHPEVIKNLEVLHYHAENNFPIEKELVFKMVPELFVHEINRLDVRDRERFKKPRLSYTRADGDQLEVDAKQAAIRATESDRLFEKTMTMEMYLLEQSADVFKLYEDKLKDEVLYGGHIGLAEYLIQLEVMDDENKKDWEKRLWSEVQELRMIQDDIKALRQHLDEKPAELVIPEFIMDPQIRAEALQLLKFIEKYETFDIRDTLLLPIPAYRGPDFEERLRQSMDVDAMIEESNQELKDYANKRLPLPGKSMSEKDEDLLKKVSLIASAIKIDPPPILAADINEQYITEEQFRRDLPTEKRILVDELYKILYFNNQDPETYNIQFWADYFHLTPSVVRNVMNYVAYPIVDLQTKKVKEVLYFVDTDLQKRRKELLLDLDRDSYLRFLEHDYSKRSQEMYVGELGHFGVGSLEAPQEEDMEKIGQGGGLTANQIKDIMDDKRIMEDIEKEIKQITDGNANNISKVKNMKITI